MNNGIISSDSQMRMCVDQSLQYSKDEMLNIGKSIPDSLFPIFSIEQKEVAWQMGDHCLAKFSEDDLYYYARILSISDDRTKCEVLYPEYKTKETVNVADLLTDYGFKKTNMARFAQPSLNRRMAMNGNAPSNGLASITKDDDVSNVSNQFSNLKITAKFTEMVEGNRQSATEKNDTKPPNHLFDDATGRTERCEEQKINENDSTNKTAQSKIIYSDEEILNIKPTVPKMRLPFFCNDGKGSGCAMIPPEFIAGADGTSLTPQPDLENIDYVHVLMVAEKPLMAKQIAEILAEDVREIRYRRASNQKCEIREYDGRFMDRPARFKVTSTCGHVLKPDFPDEYHDRRIEPTVLYDCPIVKVEANPDLEMNQFLAEEAQGCDYLVLWLDCDLEGENICFEVMAAVQPFMKQSARIGGEFMDRVFRARFSSHLDIEGAMDRLVKPNLLQSRSIDAKKELDLRIGVSMSIYLTQFLRNHNRDRDIKMVSYGMCQTPTLAFCVEQHEKVEQFQSEHYYSISCEVNIPQINEKIKLDFGNGPMRNEQDCRALVNKLRSGLTAKLIGVHSEVHEKSQPEAMNTVELLKAASSKLRMSPIETMEASEGLYTKGYLTYPRTKATTFPQKMDVKGHLQKVVKPQELEEWSNGTLTLNDFTEVDEPKKGDDCYGHPPVYPTKALDLKDRRVTRQETELYEYICRHFLATLMKPCKYETHTLKFLVGKEEFKTQVRRELDPGYTKIMPWESVAVDDDLLCSAFDDKKQLELTFTISDVNMAKTSPPTHLTESELVAKMDQYAIGTDGSIPTHIENISKRGYVKVSKDRKLVPTPLGIALVKAFRELDQELVLPTMRAEVERSLSRIATGEAERVTVRDEILNVHKEKMLKLTQNFNKVENSFKGCFPPRKAREPEASDHRPFQPSRFGSVLTIDPWHTFGVRSSTNDMETNAANKRRLPTEAPSSNKRFGNFNDNWQNY